MPSVPSIQLDKDIICPLTPFIHLALHIVYCTFWREKNNNIIFQSFRPLHRVYSRDSRVKTAGRLAAKIGCDFTVTFKRFPPQFLPRNSKQITFLCFVELSGPAMTNIGGVHGITLLSSSKQIGTFKISYLLSFTVLPCKS